MESTDYAFPSFANMYSIQVFRVEQCLIDQFFSLKYKSGNTYSYSDWNWIQMEVTF